jgi:hypothetical protein
MKKDQTQNQKKKPKETFTPREATFPSARVVGDTTTSKQK